jgi:quercetin dioxygenase-like cupin family protein
MPLVPSTQTPIKASNPTPDSEITFADSDEPAYRVNHFNGLELFRLQYELRRQKRFVISRDGNPLETSELVGPLIDKQAFDGMQRALDGVKAVGGVVTGGTCVTEAGKDTAYYVKPALVEMPKRTGPVLEDRKATAPVADYVLSGELTVQVDGQPPKTFDAGESRRMPVDVPHMTTAGAAGAKVVATWVPTPGMPFNIPVP